MVIRWLFILLLLVPTLTSAETSPRLDSISIAALNQLGIKTTGTNLVTLAKVYGFVNESIEDVSSYWPAVEKLDTVVVYDSVEGGRLPSDFVGIKWCQWLVNDSLRIPLRYIPEDSLAERFGSAERAMADPAAIQEGRENFYYYTFSGRALTAPKVWHDTLTTDSIPLLIAYYAIGDKLTAVTDSTNILPGFRKYLRWSVYEKIENLRGRYDHAAYWGNKYESAKPSQVGVAEVKK